MKILLDENLPKKLKQDFAEYDVQTVRENGWNGKKNGELLRCMQDDGFTVLMTFDKNLQHQQNFTKHIVTVIVLNARNNSHEALQPLVPKIKLVLNNIPPNGVIVVE